MRRLLLVPAVAEWRQACADAWQRIITFTQRDR